MREIKNKIPTIILIIVLTYVTLYYIYNFWSDGLYARFGTNVGLNVFNEFQNNIFGTIMYGFLGTSLIIDTFYKNKKSGFQNHILTRTGYEKRIKYEIKEVIKYSFIIRVVFNLILIIMIQLFFSQFNFKSDCNYSDVFSNNYFISFLIYNIYSSIGFSIFSLFIYSVSYFIKNQYMYKISGIIAMIGFTCLFSLIGNQIQVSSINIKYTSPFLLAFFLINLVEPGMNGNSAITTTFGEHIWFFYTCFCFIIYSFILIEIRKKKEMRNG